MKRRRPHIPEAAARAASFNLARHGQRKTSKGRGNDALTSKTRSNVTEGTPVCQQGIHYAPHLPTHRAQRRAHPHPHFGPIATFGSDPAVAASHLAEGGHVFGSRTWACAARASTPPWTTPPTTAVAKPTTSRTRSKSFRPPWPRRHHGAQPTTSSTAVAATTSAKAGAPTLSGGGNGSGTLFGNAGDDRLLGGSAATSSTAVRIRLQAALATTSESPWRPATRAARHDGTGLERGRSVR
jgi:hypothetical protein